MALNQSRAPRVNKANTLIVGASGCDFATIQAAIDAAVAAGAAINNPWLIFVTEGVVREAYTLAAGVTVLFQEDARNLGLTCGSSRRIPSPQPNEFFAPYGGALVSIRHDDSTPEFFTVGNGGCGAQAPWQYLRDLGIPWTESFEAGKPSNVLTAAQVRTMLEDCGCEIASHSTYTAHQTQPVTLAEMLDGLAGARATLEAMQDTAAIPNALGIACRGWIHPGGLWTGINTYDLADYGIGRVVRENYEWSSGYIGGTSPSTGKLQRHLAQIYSHELVSSTSSAAGGEMDQWVEEMCTAGCRSVILMHTCPSTFKAFIDKFASARAAQRVHFVTMSTLFDAAVSPIVNTGYWGGVQAGTFDGWAAGVQTVDADGNGHRLYNWTFSKYGADAASTTISTETNGSGLMLQLANGNVAAGRIEASVPVRVIPGYSYKLIYDGARTAGSGSNNCHVRLKLVHSGGVERYLNFREVTAGTLTRYEHCFYIPKTVTTASIMFETGYGANVNFQIDNVALVRI